MSEDHDKLADDRFIESTDSLFENETQIGDLFFLAKSWPAWFVNPETKGIAPITRLYIGDSRGNVIISRNVTLGGMFDLSVEIMRMTAAQVDLLTEMKGFHAYVPEKKDYYLKMIENMTEILQVIKTNIDEIEIKTPDDNEGVDEVRE